MRQRRFSTARDLKWKERGEDALLPLSLRSSGTQCRMYSPSGSTFSLCDAGLKMRKYGCGSHPVDALHCQPPLFEPSCGRGAGVSERARGGEERGGARARE